MKIPSSGRKKALILVDVQPAFITSRNKHILKNIQKLLKGASYDLYVEALFHAEKGSLWDKQTNWICPKDEDFYTDASVRNLLPLKKYISIEKTTKSVWKGKPALDSILRKKRIREVHIIGYDTNDCVLATAYEAFDLSYFTYIIEECVQTSSDQGQHERAIDLLRHLNLTNRSCLEKIDFIHVM